MGMLRISAERYVAFGAVSSAEAPKQVRLSCNARPREFTFANIKIKIYAPVTYPKATVWHPTPSKPTLSVGK